jgi:signal transduction histidine kinase
MSMRVHERTLTFETDSFNFIARGEGKNAENIIVLHDATVAQRYGQERE